jgi:hypothetical protein
VDLTNDLLLIAMIAILAQAVNGSMGMGYGVITSSLLLALGMPPVTMSAAVHVAEVGTTVTSGVSHWRLGNVDWRLTSTLAVPGAVGGFAGATLLSNIPTSTARPLVTVILLSLGLLILVRFANGRHVLLAPRWKKRFLSPLGGIAGFFDATGGGGWGPITMGTLMSRPPAEPRIVIGSVNASETAVTLAASIGFVLGIGFAGIPWAEVVALMIGGMLAAPPAAWLARHMRARMLGLSVGILLLVLNTRLLGTFAGFSAPAIAAAMLAVAVACLAFVAYAQRRSADRVPSVALDEAPAA